MTFLRYGSVALIFGFLGAFVSSAVATELRYHPEPKQKFVYKVEVVAELPDKIETSKGAISYEASSTAEGIKLKYNGGLHRTSKSKADRRRGGFPSRPPFHRGPMGMRARFYDGLTTMSNTLIMTKDGEILSLMGNSQMPYLLGNLSLIPFERLPGDEKTSWTDDRGASVSEQSNHSRPGPRFFTDRFRSGKRLSANEVSTYKLQGKADGVRKFKKTYKLQCGDGQESIDMTGTGVWAFNEKEGMPESSECKYNLVVKEDGVTITVPVTVKYERLSGEALVAYEKEEKEKKELAKRRHDERMAERKAPLTEAETRSMIADLRSGNGHRQHMALFKLVMKEDLQADPRLIQAVRALLSDDNRAVRDMAQRALPNLSPDLKKKSGLNKAYESFMPLKEHQMGRFLTGDPSFPPGLLVAVNDHMRWSAARIIKDLGGGSYQVQFQGGASQKKAVSWSDIRLAPPEVEQTFVDREKLKKLYAHYVDPTSQPATPAVTASSKGSPSKVDPTERGYRTWTDDSGTFTVVAKFVRSDGTTVILKNKKGAEIKVPLARLSEQDRNVAKRLKENPPATNPFQTNPFE